MRTKTLILAAVALANTALANAAGSGGGGGWGSSPSASAEQIDPVAKYREGLQYLQDQDFKAAEKALKSVARVADKDANVHYALGLAHSGQSEWKQASRAFKKAVKYAPERVDARYQYGLSLLRRDKLKDARKQLDALRVMAADCDACPTEAALNEAIEKLDTALQAPETTDLSRLTPAIEQVSLAAGDTAYIEAVRLINLEQFDDAIHTLKIAESAFGPHPDVLTYRGFAHRKQGEYELALRFYRAALAVTPTHRGANEYLGEYYVELGDIPAAKRQLRKVEANCEFGCAEARELKAWIDAAVS